MRIVFAPWGSLGDLHPYLAVALEMQRRGHDVLLATSEIYREKVQEEGIAFHGIRPDMQPFIHDPERVAKIMHPLRGPEYLFRQIILPSLRDSYDDLCAAAKDADLLVSHIAMLAAPLAAEKLRLAWVSVALQPAVLFSTSDPPYFPITGNLLRRSPTLARLVMKQLRLQTKRWMKPVYNLRGQLNLTTDKHPFFEGQFSPYGTLAMFSPVFARTQPDWPPHVITTGFPFYDKSDASSAGLPAGIEEFLARGSAPVVFTLGSSAVFAPADFYVVGANAARRVGCRALLLAGPAFEERLSIPSSDEMLVAAYAPYSALFPQAAAIVHQGGIGTTAQALRSGKPMIVMPFSHDQPDNAARVARLGTGKVIPRRKYTVDRVSRMLQRLLSDSSVLNRASELGAAIQAEDGIRSAADALENLSLGKFSENDTGEA
jgi:rhamnosyltransferase subunit B